MLRDNGQIAQVSRTMWSSHYGPILDSPGLGWTDQSTLTYRDANIDNDESLDQYLGMLTADDLDQFVDVHEQINGVPLFNTIASSRDGRTWYADTSATPNLSDQAIAAYQASAGRDPTVDLAADFGTVLLDGSDPRFEWVEEEDGARDPGLVPFDEQPMVERDDYVFNANDSYWLPHATETLEGDYSPLHGPARTARWPRTRENATVLGDTSPDGPAGDDGTFSLDELTDAAMQNRAYTPRALLDDVVDRCQPTTTVDLPTLSGEDGSQALPAATVDISQACQTLDQWDGVYDLDRAGPPIWRELMGRFPHDALITPGALWAHPFDPTHPIETPSGLAARPSSGPDPILENLARAVQILDHAGIAVDTPLGELQYALRHGEPIPIHGGDNPEGATNIVRHDDTNSSILDPELTALDHRPLAPQSTLARTGDHTGYLVNGGTSFVLAIAFTADGPQARAILAHSNTEDPTSDLYTQATQRFSDKQWRDVAFTDEQVDAETTNTTTVRG